VIWIPPPSVVTTVAKHVRRWFWVGSTPKICIVPLRKTYKTYKTYDKIKVEIGGISLCGISFYCLIVRFGADQVVVQGPEDEREIGRLQKHILNVTVSCDDKSNAVLTWRLPVHDLLGTQFKCFAEGDHDSKIIEDHGRIRKIIENVDENPSVSGRRVYFLVKDFNLATTSDGFVNNIIRPE
jgi:hypothetical protein